VHVEFTSQATLKVSQRELRLIGLGLCGKLKAREDIEAAQELNRRLLLTRAQAYGLQAEIANKALEVAGAPGDRGPSEGSGDTATWLDDESLQMGPTAGGRAP
jgi:hypothetical protein